MCRAASGAIDRRQNPTAMHPSEWIEQMGSGFTFECRVAVADLDDPEAQRLRDRGWRKPAIDQGLHDFEAGHCGNVRFGSVDAVGHWGGHDLIFLVGYSAPKGMP